MTYSIVARDPNIGELGIAVASRFFAVGAAVPYMKGGVGAIATQAFVSPLYGTDGLEMLASGALDPTQIIQRLTERDKGCAQRQMHLIDAKGRNAAYTGEKCISWAGHRIADNVSVAGNMLKGPEVVDATLSTYLDHPELEMADRLLLAMQAGEDAGGDKRGKQSAALKIYRNEAYAYLDIRADDHPDPLSELRRLLAVARERYLFVVQTMPTTENPSGLTDRTILDQKIAEADRAREEAGLKSASFASGPPL